MMPTLIGSPNVGAAVASADADDDGAAADGAAADGLSFALLPQAAATIASTTSKPIPKRFTGALLL
jgi:hypothetical protein